MNIFSHILASFVLASVLGIEGKMLAVAILFGVLPDMDHIFRLGEYYHENHLHFVKEWPWRTSFQEFTGLIWVVPMSFLLQSFIPVIFYMLHLLLDYTMTYEKRPFAPFKKLTIHGFFPENGKFEIALIIILSWVSIIWLI